MGEPVTPADLKALAGYVPVIFRYDSPEVARRRARLTAWLQQQIGELERQAVVFRPDGEGWAIGSGSDVRTYAGTPAILRAAHLAIAGREARAADFAEPGAAKPCDSVRNRLRRASEWVTTRTGCLALADALKRMRVASGLIVHDHRYPSAPRICTE
jgi:hypothetical protein